MQFTTIAFTLVLSTIASATAIPRDSATSTCSSGQLKCCDSVVSVETGADNNMVGIVHGLLNIVFGENITGVAGVDCEPLTGTSCSVEPLCCSGSTVLGGHVTLGCSHVTN